MREPELAARRPPKSPITELRRNHELAERVSLLEQAPLFSVLRGEDIRDLADKFHAVRYRRAEVSFREGAPSERLFLIDDGRVNVTTPPPTGQEVPAAVLGPGQIVGLLVV